MKEILTLENIQLILRLKRPYMKEQYHVKEIGAFGSYVQGCQPNRPAADISMDFYKMISALAYLRLKLNSKSLLRRKVILG